MDTPSKLIVIKLKKIFEMRKFYFTIVDDDSGDQGYGRFLKLLKQKNYIKSVGNISNSKETKGECLTESINFKVYTADYGDALLESFCDAYSRFKNENDVFDFYVFDLKFDKEMFLPTADENTCDQAKQYVKNLSAIDIEVGRKSYQLAGLDFFNCVEINNKPKIILSAATQTVTLRTTFKLIEKRLRDVFVIDNDPGTHLDDSNAQVNSAFDAIDTYLQSRQIEIINRQSPEKTKALSDIITSWSKNSVPKADEPLIPDDGENEDDKENCWSLRTLFPKQVNRIELELNESESKRYIQNVLNNFNFRDIIFWLLHEHGNADGFTRGQLPELNVRSRLNALKEVDFPIIASKAAGYKRFSDLAEVRDFFKKPIEEVKKSIEQQLRNVVIKEFDFLDFCFIYGNDKANKVNNDVLKWISEFGIFIGDVAYIKSIAQENQKHCDATDVSTKINIAGSGKNKILMLEFIFATKKNDFNDSINSVQSIIKSFFKSERFLGKPTLEDQGIGDLMEIIVKRYKADGKIQLGTKSIGMDTKATLINEKDIQVKYMFTIKSKKS